MLNELRSKLIENTVFLTWVTIFFCMLDSCSQFPQNSIDFTLESGYTLSLIRVSGASLPEKRGNSRKGLWGVHTSCSLSNRNEIKNRGGSIIPVVKVFASVARKMR